MSKKTNKSNVLASLDVLTYLYNIDMPINISAKIIRFMDLYNTIKTDLDKIVESNAGEDLTKDTQKRIQKFLNEETEINDPIFWEELKNSNILISPKRLTSLGLFIQ